MFKNTQRWDLQMDLQKIDDRNVIYDVIKVKMLILTSTPVIPNCPTPITLNFEDTALSSSSKSFLSTQVNRLFRLSEVEMSRQ